MRVSVLCCNKVTSTTGRRIRSRNKERRRSGTGRLQQRLDGAESAAACTSLYASDTHIEKKILAEFQTVIIILNTKALEWPPAKSRCRLVSSKYSVLGALNRSYARNVSTGWRAFGAPDGTCVFLTRRFPSRSPHVTTQQCERYFAIVIFVQN
ncbi:hypothetical protein EVAR_65581_1 [Eumeta japonica]|uniref:Uncharacterized protein n=1 Tax=Eumeta variegata TaxID=151549 RepID=A0A4C1Z5U1_EUMVA|nr:hypothetical protein EVAR_65581_1 [Eumeta japonica]